MCCGNKQRANTVQVRRQPNVVPVMPRVMKPDGMRGIVTRLCSKCKYPMSRVAKMDKVQKRLVTEWVCMRRECRNRE